MVNNMEVTIISKQIVKPSSQSLHHLKPYKLCLFDQLTPVTYPSLVFFYPIIAEHPNFNLPKTLTHLKNSLSETLTLFYPFSGRTKNNTLIHDFHVGHPKRVIYPDLPRSSSSFPPRDWPQNQLDLMDHLWFKESNYITRRFVFNAKSISNLRTKAKSQRVPKPSRIETLTCFIWKHATAASWSISGSPKTSVLVHAVNLRQRMKPPQSLDACTGNLFWWGTVVANPSSETELELN
ncbi:vinorine synthase-like [Ziziphus jujuba]|uniref:Vinorine synthase-like n=1 Tax=Ziziphus jujuba TaxID=326968 RepID=A0ABM4AGL2_ZIZJJ|nr:vinorine synthase-like [Ziziphus jujuba]